MKFHIYQLKVTNSISRGDDFRTDYSHLGMLCALFPSVPVLALSATASKKDRQVIKGTLHMINPLEVVGSLNRPNIFYEKVFRNGPDVESYEEILLPIARNLLVQKIQYPLTIVYLSLRWCGFAYRLFERILGPEQYFPAGADPIPENRLFSQFHSPQTAAMKEQILQELGRSCSKLRVVFATIAMGMGVDIPAIRNIIHIGPPRTVREYMQETGRAGRDGSSSRVSLFYNSRDIGKNKKLISEDIRAYCHLEQSCMRKYLLGCLDAGLRTDEQVVGHSCCSNCSLVCDCANCTEWIAT